MLKKYKYLNKILNKINDNFYKVNIFKFEKNFQLFFIFSNVLKKILNMFTAKYCHELFF